MQDVKERMADDGADPVGNTPQEFSAYIQSEMSKWAKVIKQSGAKANYAKRPPGTHRSGASWQTRCKKLSGAR